MEDLREGRALTLAETQTVLVEFSERVPWTELSRRADPAHREPDTDPSLPTLRDSDACARRLPLSEEIIDAGILIQSNIQEVEGGLFSDMARWVKKMYKNVNIHFAASDMHNLDTRPPISKEQLAWFDRKVDEEYREELFSGNIRKLLARG